MQQGEEMPNVGNLDAMCMEPEYQHFYPHGIFFATFPKTLECSKD